VVLLKKGGRIADENKQFVDRAGYFVIPFPDMGSNASHG
jgi:hypothetical protein